MYDSLAQLSLSNSAFLAKKNFKLHNWSVFESYFTATPCVDGGKISNNDVTMFAHGQVVSKVTLTRSKTSLRACVREGGGPQEGEVTCGKLPHLTCKCDHIKMRDFMDRRVTSPTWGPPPPSKQALSAKSLIWHLFLIFFFLLERFCSWPYFESEDSMDHLHDGVILLLRPESFSFFLSYLNSVIPMRFK